MRATVPPALERYRVVGGHSWASSPSLGMAGGLFLVPGPCGETLTIIVSNGTDWPYDAPVWEHVSVSTRRRTPNWREMEFARDLCFEPTETVIQFSVPRDVHVNVHEHCLHLWRPLGVTIPLPPKETVG